MCKIVVLFNLPKCFCYLHLYGLGNIYQRLFQRILLSSCWVSWVDMFERTMKRKEYSRKTSHYYPFSTVGYRGKSHCVILIQSGLSCEIMSRTKGFGRNTRVLVAIHLRFICLFLSFFHWFLTICLSTPFDLMAY